jgi:ubiquinone/menaquinone biosynthesis C-methylase UbiE
MDTKAHWEHVYRTRNLEEVSWHQRTPGLSLDLIRRAAPDLRARIIDVGGGTSSLVDHLLRDGYSQITVLDVSEAALRHAQHRLGAAAQAVTWIEADVRAADLPEAAFDVWHDRAVFHFLTEEPDRQLYVAQTRRAVRPGGHLIVATFADDGPTRCSGLPVARYSAEELSREFGDAFQLVENVRERHVTPSGVQQPFIYCLWKAAG